MRKKWAIYAGSVVIIQPGFTHGVNIGHNKGRATPDPALVCPRIYEWLTLVKFLPARQSKGTMGKIIGVNQSPAGGAGWRGGN